MGGAIAQLLAIHHPSRVFSLTTIATSSGDPNLPGPTPLARNAMSTEPPATTDKDALIRYLVNRYRAFGSIDDEVALSARASTQVDRSWYPDGTARQVAAATIADNCDRRKELEKINVPTTIIHGDVDPLVSPEAANQLAGAITGSQLFIVNGMGHDLSERFVVPISQLIVRNARRSQDAQVMK
jgi:pimeloyl-ACP methyl ester carboxylesterase